VTEREAPNVGGRPHLITIVIALAAFLVSGVSAVLSYEALTLNRENNVITQRAYLTVQEPHIADAIPSANKGRIGNTYNIQFKVVNLGNTPASKIELKLAILSFAGKLLDERRDVILDLGPKDVSSYAYPAFIERQPVDFRFLLTLRGEVTYEDMFGNRRKNGWCFSQKEGSALTPCNPASYPLPE
jgi:hypothetical protein